MTMRVTCLKCGGTGNYKPDDGWGVYEICPACDGVGSIQLKEKPVLTGLIRDNPATKEGKYLVKRRDGTVVEWPNFVLGARDRRAEVALRAYADEAEKLGDDPGWVAALRRTADEWAVYRAEHGDGDPGMGIHRVDDPATIAEMRKGWSA